VALFFILAILIGGKRVIKYIDKLLNIQSAELFLLVVIGVLFLVAGFSETLHVAEAIGALLVGLIMAESIHAKKIEHNILPFRDFFGAIFFFNFGLTIDPLSLGGGVVMAVVAAIFTIIGNIVAGMFSGRMSKISDPASANIGFTLSARGEFSIIMANMGKAGGLMPVLQSFVVIYVLILAIVAPILTKESKKIYNLCNLIYKKIAGRKRNITS
jgi:CPA2 family monovalent cation:H+ antiporter-2